MTSIEPRIAIVGGGPGGLTLGALLHKHGVPFTIYELRSRPTDEELAEPSGMLDLHEESGLAAIRACGLYEQFTALTGDCEESMIVADKHGKIVHADQGEGASRPEIARHNIVKLFLSILPDQSIRYGTKLVSATRDPGTGEVTLELEPTVGDGATTSETYDLVIGADGAWSRVRPILSPDKPQSSGLHYLTMNIKHISTRYPHLASLVGKGSFIALGNKHGVDSHRAAQDSAQLYVFLNASGQDEAVDSLSTLPIPELKDRVLNDKTSFADYGVDLKELMAVAFSEEAKNRGNIQIKPLATLPIGHRWTSTSGVTLIGDAAHLMHPAGEGVNLAMWDALDLSSAISGAWEKSLKDGGESFRTALCRPMRLFEGEMFARAQEKAEEAKMIYDIMFSEDGAQGLADLMKRFFEMAQPQ
jgi:2-polyprenyl-6-methoxyphenol hydroxylase-like FAD-dependent oxidoreductase